MIAFRFETAGIGYVDANGFKKCFVIAGLYNSASPWEPVLCDVETIPDGK